MIRFFKMVVPVLLAVGLFSCEEDDPKSTEKQILSFKISSLSPEVAGVVNETAKTIEVTVPPKTNVTSLVPAIEVSAGATVSPAGGVPTNFSAPVTYTVTAEDGSATTYVVTVNVLKSNEKKIVSFKITSISPEVVGTIDETNKKINLIVPNALEVTALAPVIQVSEGASVSPASGTAVNFTAPVNYQVTAEDGSQQNYEVSVTANPNVSFSIDAHVGSLEVEQAGYFLIKGNNFGTDASKIKVSWINQNNQAATDIPSLVIVNNTSIGFLVPATLALGQYKIRVVINFEQRTMPEVFTVVLPRPEITAIDKFTVEKGQTITISGKYLQATGNVVKLHKNNMSYGLTIVSESTTSIVAKVTDLVPADTYTLSVRSNNKDSFYNTKQITVTPPATAPVITSIEKTSYNVGETMIINGRNLKKVGVATNINFKPFLGGTTQVRSAVANAEGTQVTFAIPANFPKGTYVIVVEVDFEYSEEYSEVIQIK